MILLNILQLLQLGDKNVFEIMTLADNLVLIYRFQDDNLVLCSLNTFCEIFLLEYGPWKLQLESWNTNHELLNQTL